MPAMTEADMPADLHSATEFAVWLAFGCSPFPCGFVIAHMLGVVPDGLVEAVGLELGLLGLCLTFGGVVALAGVLTTNVLAQNWRVFLYRRVLATALMLVLPSAWLFGF